MSHVKLLQRELDAFDKALDQVTDPGERTLLLRALERKLSEWGRGCKKEAAALEANVLQGLESKYALKEGFAQVAG